MASWVERQGSTLAPVPVTVASFSPGNGPAGTPVSITGTGFTSATGVKFGAVTQLKFTIVSGKTNLEVVYAFSDPVAGAGTLFEVCDDHTSLIAVTAAHPAVRYHVSA